MDTDQRALILKWQRAVRSGQIAHYDASARATSLNLALGIPVVVLTTIVGTGVFSTLGENSNVALQIVVGLLSIIAAIVSAVHTFLKYSERAERHREAGVRYAALQKEIDIMLAFPRDDDSLAAWIDDFRKRWDAVAIEAPTIPERVWKKVNVVVQADSQNTPPTTAVTRNDG